MKTVTPQFLEPNERFISSLAQLIVKHRSNLATTLDAVLVGTGLAATSILIF